MEIPGRTLLVTGGASGLGAACCRRFVAAGANVVIADIDSQAGERLASELGDRTRFHSMDVTNDSDAQGAVDLAVSTFGQLHGLLTCAGILGAARVVGRDGPHDLAEFRKIIDVNLTGTFNVARLAAVAMAQAPDGDDGERGVIVMTASVAAWDGQIGQSAYAASKGAIASMALPMARELGGYGIRVAAIAPGIFETPMMAAVTDELRSSLQSQIPFPKRFGIPDEFAALAQHIVENPMINGTVVRLDGAVRMGPK